MFDELAIDNDLSTQETIHVDTHHTTYQQNVACRDQHRIEDRPKIPQELWDQLDLAAKLWYCGRDKEDIDKIVANQSRQQSVNQVASLQMPEASSSASCVAYNGVLTPTSCQS